MERSHHVQQQQTRLPSYKWAMPHRHALWKARGGLREPDGVSCVVHNPEDLALIASWKMPMELSVHQAASIASFQTEEKDYDLRQKVAWTA
jgi:hypothetical protein